MLMFAHVTIFIISFVACCISMRTLNEIPKMKSTYNPSGSDGVYVKYADYMRSSHLYKSSVTDAGFVFLLALVTTTVNVVSMLNREALSPSSLIATHIGMGIFNIIAIAYAKNTHREFLNVAFHFRNEHRREVDHRLATKEKLARAKHSDPFSYKDNVKSVEDANEGLMAMASIPVPLWGSAESLNDK